MYFHQPIVCFFFSNNASVIVLTKALRSSVCLCLFVSVVTLSEHRTSRNVGTMFVRCFYNVHTMFAQCSYNVRTMAKKVRTMFVQCPTKVRTILYELFGHCTNIVRTLCAQHPANQCSVVHQKMPADRPKHLTVILLFFRLYT